MKYLFKQIEDGYILPGELISFRLADMIDEDEANRRIHNIWSKTDLEEIGLEILTAPPPPKQSDNYDKLENIIDDALYRITKIKEDLKCSRKDNQDS